MNLCLSRSKGIYGFKGVEMYLLSVNASKLNLSPEETLVNCFFSSLLSQFAMCRL